MNVFRDYQIVNTLPFPRSLWCHILLKHHCNISPVEYLEDGYLWATDWDLEFFIPNLPQGISAIAIPWRAIQPGHGANGILCRVCNVEERRRWCIVTLVPIVVQDASPLKFQFLKKEWPKLRSECISVHIPSKNILLLQKR